MMELVTPEWLLLLPLLGLGAWLWPALGLRRPLRALVAVVAVVLLAQPRARLMKHGMDLWVLVDRSESTGGDADAALPEWKQLLERGRRHRDDRVRWVDYAADVVPQELNAGGPYTGGRKLSRTALAVQNTLAMRDPDKASRVLVFTDGYSTEPLAGLAERLQAERVPLDVRLLPGRDGDDFRVRRLSLPPRVRAGEPFLIETEVMGPRDGVVPLTVLRDGQPLETSEVTIVKGKAVQRFTDRIASGGAYRYEVRLDVPGDPWPGNNRGESWIEVSGGPRLLLITNYTDDPAAAAFGRQFTVETVTQLNTLRPGMLTGCKAVVLNNVPAWDVPADFIAALPFYVEVQGGGLLMAGGRRSFGAGGWFQSAVDPLLPVSMELKEDQRKVQTALSIVLDRSGSMAAAAGGGTKMDLANEGAVQAIEMLGMQDSAGVLAVDSSAHTAVPFQKVGDRDNRKKMTSAARRVKSSGGGIYVYEGLKEGWSTLKGIGAGTRHIILFADAADAEEPGDYIKLLAEVTAAGATTSVIALGTEGDSDAAFLKDVAARGKGRIFFTDRAEDVPAVFTAEAVAVARSLFIDEPLATAATGQWQELAGKAIEWPGRVGGYNLSYRRQWAGQALVSKDEYAAPLVAWGRRGAGRSAAVSFPLGGEVSEAVRGWGGYGDFLQTLARWLAGDEVPPGVGLRWSATGTTLAVELLHDGSWETAFGTDPPRLLVASGSRAERRRELIWERMAPGSWQATAELEEGELVRGAVQAGKFTLPFGPASVGTGTEWQFDPGRIAELREVAVRSGGRELVDLSTAWLSPPVREWTDLRRWVLPGLLGMILLEVLMTRTGWRLPVLGGRGRVKGVRRAGPVKVAGKAAVKVVPVAAAAVVVEEPREVAGGGTEAAGEVVDAAAARRERFARARKR